MPEWTSGNDRGMPPESSLTTNGTKATPVFHSRVPSCPWWFSEFRTLPGKPERDGDASKSGAVAAQESGQGLPGLTRLPGMSFVQCRQMMGIPRLNREVNTGVLARDLQS